MPSIARTNLLILLLTVLSYSSANAFEYKSCAHSILAEKRAAERLNEISKKLNLSSIKKDCGTCKEQSQLLSTVNKYIDELSFLASLLDTNSIQKTIGLEMIDLRISHTRQLIKVINEAMLEYYNIEGNTAARTQILAANNTISEYLYSTARCSK